MFTDIQDFLEHAAPPGDATSSAVIVMGIVGQGVFLNLSLCYMHYNNSFLYHATQQYSNITTKSIIFSNDGKRSVDFLDELTGFQVDQIQKCKAMFFKIVHFSRRLNIGI